MPAFVLQTLPVKVIDGLTLSVSPVADGLGWPVDSLAGAVGVSFPDAMRV